MEKSLPRIPGKGEHQTQKGYISKNTTMKVGYIEYLWLGLLNFKEIKACSGTNVYRNLYIY